MAAIEESAGRVLGLGARRSAPLPAPDDAWDPARGQHSSTRVLQMLLDRRVADGVRALGVTEADLFIPMLTFVYGQAQLGGPAAVVSLARLRQEFYGFPPAPALLLERVAKEAIHELGHTFGLLHCLDHGCAMSLSSNILQVDEKRAELCAGCAVLLRERRGASAPRSRGSDRTESAS
jgi:archaemetzincin